MLVRVARLALSITLAWAGIAKLLRTADFARSSRDLLPRWLAFAAPVGARVLPLAELATAGALLTGRWARPGLISASVMLSGFLALVVRARWLHLDSSCSCFGVGRGEPVDILTVARTAVLSATAVAASAAALLDPHPQLPLLAPGADVLTTLTAGAAVFTAAVVAVAALRLLTTVEAEIRSRGDLHGATEEGMS